MSNFDIIRAWKDEDFGSSLSEAQRSQLPESPVGKIELLSDEDMELLAGGGSTFLIANVENLSVNEDNGSCEFNNNAGGNDAGGGAASLLDLIG